MPNEHATATPIQASAWFALYTRHQHEKSVARLFSGKGVEIFLPLYNAPHRWKDRITQLSLPLFPNYLFAFAGTDWFCGILQTPGIYDFVRVGGLPAPVPAEDLAGARRIASRGLAAEPYPFLQCGDRARVKSGPLEGLEGILIRKKSFYRLVLSVELLMKSIPVEVEVADVERIATRHDPKRFPAATASLGGWV